MKPKSSIPLPTIRRLPGYYYSVNRAIVAGETHISTSELAQTANLSAIQVRKDIEYTEVRGTTRIGYPCIELEKAIGKILGLEQEYRAVLVGVGSLGTALLGHRGFHQYGIRFEAAFDTNIELQEIQGIPVYHPEQIQNVVPDLGVQIAVLTVPADATAVAAASCIAAGIRGIWNFSGTLLQRDIPDNVLVRNIDLGLRFSALFAEFHHLVREQ